MTQICLKKLLFLSAILLGWSLSLSKGASAASNAPAISLNNTDFVVSIAFVAFLAIMIYVKVPSKIGSLLDNRSKTIEDEINNANSILEESKTLLAELEREHKINIEKAKTIVTDAENEAKNMLSEAKKEVRLSIQRKVKLAEDQIKATEASVVKSIKDRAIDHSIAITEAELLKKARKKIDDPVLTASLKDIKLGLKTL